MIFLKAVGTVEYPLFYSQRINNFKMHCSLLLWEQRQLFINQHVYLLLSRRSFRFHWWSGPSDWCFGFRRQSLEFFLFYWLRPSTIPAFWRILKWCLNWREVIILNRFILWTHAQILKHWYLSATWFTLQLRCPGPNFIIKHLPSEC